jgi:hypothetical protein
MTRGHPWIVVLNGTVLLGGDAHMIDGFGFGEGGFGDLPFGEVLSVIYTSSQVKGFLSKPPEGLGVPGLRTEDQSYPQRDGVSHFSDWYEPRVITLSEVFIEGYEDSSCEDCNTARQNASDIMRAWSRHCGETELVIWTDCPPGATVEERAITGPFGVVGRPRVAEIEWVGYVSDSANALLRFDSVDHRLYILDAEGTPGSGVECAVLSYDTLPAPPTPDVIYPLDDPADVPPEYNVWGYSHAYDAAGVPLPLQDTQPIGGYMPKGYPTLYANGGKSSFTFQGPNNWFFRNRTIPAARSVSFWYGPLPSNQQPDTGLLSTTYMGTGAIGTVDGLYRSKVRAGGVDYPFSAPTIAVLEDGLNHHIVWSVDATSTYIIVDGVLRETLAAGAAAAFPTGTFGNTAGLGLRELAYFSNIRLYSVKVTAAQAQAMYHSDTNTAAPGATTVVDVAGTECVPVQVTFEGIDNDPNGFSLSAPRITTEDGNFVGLSSNLSAGQIITIDTETGTATDQFDNDYSSAITGDPFLNLGLGLNSVIASTADVDDNGTISICWRPAVVSA